MIKLRNLFVGISFFPFFIQALVTGFSGEMTYQQNMNIGSGLFCLGLVVMAAVLGQVAGKNAWINATAATDDDGVSHEVRVRKQMNILLGVLLFVPPLVILVLPGGYFSTPFHWAEFCRWCCWAIPLVYLLVPAVYRSLLDIRAALEYMQEWGSKTPVLLLVEVGLFSVVALGLFCAATLFYYMGGCTNVRIMHVASRPESCSQTWWWFLLFDYEW